MLMCADGTIYSGYTTDLARRVAAHNDGRGAKYTRSRRPVRLVYFERFESKSDAMKREAALKGLDRKAKERLIKDFGA
ncbi:MAG: GIY-YIG nuclease family protein [Clostridia bacterium]|nr:GIY-YIG nuclease family protein [Clostridia bacterium]